MFENFVTVAGVELHLHATPLPSHSHGTHGKDMVNSH
jgi:hypothetical protein